MEFIEYLRRQLLYHEQQINEIKIILDNQPKIYESSISKEKQIKNISTKNINDIVVSGLQNVTKEIFPISKSKRHQVIWLFENVLKKAVRMPEIQKAYEKYSGNNDDITMTVRLLKGVPVTGITKKIYDSDVNNKTFWGLTKWFSDDDFLPDFDPYN